MALPQGFFVGVDVLGATLLHFLWQGAVLGIAYAALRPLCASATARYRLGLIALTALLLAPVGTAVYLWTGADSSAEVQAAHGLSATVAAIVGSSDSSWHLQPMLPWLVAVWFGGVLTIASRSLWQWRRLMHLVRDASLPPREWQTRLARLCDRFNLRGPVRLLFSAAAATPMLIGWLKPAILLPASMLSGFTPAQIELIIAHELGHIRRCDYLVNLLQVAIETILFYHPVVHWISRDVRNAREVCCDDLVLQLTDGNRLAYARALADLEELRLTAPVLGAGGGVLLARIKRIVGRAEAVEPLPRSYALPLLLAAAACACLVWGPRHAAPEIAAALQRVPAQALALLSGNPLLVRPERLQVSLPVPEIRPVAASNAVIEPLAEADAAGGVRLEMPRVYIATEKLAPPRDLAAPAALAFSVPVMESAADEASGYAPLQVVQPVYPPRAMSAGVEGAVQLEYRVDADGGVSHIHVLSARPAGVFDDAAIAALKQWRFAASTQAQMRTQNFAFALHGNRTEDKCRTPTGTNICRRPGD